MSADLDVDYDGPTGEYPSIAPAVRAVDQLSGTVAYWRCRCAELEAERDHANANLRHAAAELTHLRAELEQLRAERDTARLAETRRGW